MNVDRIRAKHDTVSGPAGPQYVSFGQSGPTHDTPGFAHADLGPRLYQPGPGKARHIAGKERHQFPGLPASLNFGGAQIVGVAGIASEDTRAVDRDPGGVPWHRPEHRNMLPRDLPFAPRARFRDLRGQAVAGENVAAVEQRAHPPPKLLRIHPAQLDHHGERLRLPIRLAPLRGARARLRRDFGVTGCIHEVTSAQSGQAVPLQDLQHPFVTFPV